MNTKHIDQPLLDRLQRFAEGAGSATAKDTIRSWARRMEEGDVSVASVPNLHELISALTRLGLARSFYGVEQTAHGLRLEVLMHREGAVVEALKLEEEITETMVTDEAERRTLFAHRAEVSGKILSEIESAFSAVFRD